MNFPVGTSYPIWEKEGWGIEWCKWFSCIFSYACVTPRICNSTQGTRPSHDVQIYYLCYLIEKKSMFEINLIIYSSNKVRCHDDALHSMLALNKRR